jgi:O-antigen ligase
LAESNSQIAETTDAVFLNGQASLPRHSKGGAKLAAAPGFPATRALLFSMLFAAPLAFGAVQTVAWTSLSIVASLLLLLWAIESLRTRRISIAWSPLYVLALAFIFLGFLQMLAGRAMDPQGAREALLKLACDCIVFFVAAQAWTVGARKGAPQSKLAFRSLEATRGFAVCCAEGLCPSGSQPPTLTSFVLGAQAKPARPARAWNVCTESRRLSAQQVAKPLFRPNTGRLIWTALRHGVSLQRRNRWRVLGLAVSLYSSLLALFAILQFFSGNGFIYWHVKTDGWMFGPYVNHNHYAGLMEMLIPVSVAYAVSAKRKRGLDALLGFGTLLAIVSVLLSGSRGGWIALLFELTTLAATIVWLRPRGERRWYAAAGLLATLVLATLALWLGGSKITNRLSTMDGLARSPDVALGNRLLVAHDALRMFRDHLWLGTGLGSFAVVYPQYQSFATDTVFHHAHDDYIEALAESGLIGGVLILLAVIVFFREMCKDLRNRLITRAGWIQFGAAIGCCGIMVHSFADFNLHIPANALWFAFLLGISQAARP